MYVCVCNVYKYIFVCICSFRNSNKKSTVILYIFVYMCIHIVFLFLCLTVSRVYVKCNLSNMVISEHALNGSEDNKRTKCENVLPFINKIIGIEHNLCVNKNHAYGFNNVRIFYLYILCIII